MPSQSDPTAQTLLGHLTDPKGAHELSDLTVNGVPADAALAAQYEVITEPGFLPHAPIPRGGDATVVANVAYGFPFSVPSSFRVRRARIRVATRAGNVSAGITDLSGNRLSTSTEIAASPAGASEFAMQPAVIGRGVVNGWVSGSSSSLSLGQNSTYGDIVGGLSKTSSHPIPATLTSPAPAVPAFCLTFLSDDKTPLVGTHAREALTISVLGQFSTTKLYGVSQVNGHWVTSTDHGDTWTDEIYSPASSFPFSAIGDMIVTSTHMFCASSATGAVSRAPKDNFNTWTTITPPGMPTSTRARPYTLLHNGTFLYYGTYNQQTVAGDCKVYRSADNGDTWTEVLDVTDGRHIHAVQCDATTTDIFVTVGDAGYGGEGLYYSSTSGAAASFTKISSNRYGIAMAFPATISNVQRRILMEGDGANEPHVVGYYRALVGTPSLTDPIVWPDTSPADGGGSWSGTGRGIKLDTNNNLWFFSTAENGAAGTRDALWVCKGPWHTTPVLVEELTGNVPLAYYRTFESGTYMLNFRSRWPRLKFADQ